MAITVEVNVSVDNVQASNNPNYAYKGKFQFQQISPLDTIYVTKKGDILANKATDELDVVLNWVSNAVEIGDKLYAAHYRTPLNQSVWVLEGSGSNPGPGNPAHASGNHDITVPDGSDKASLTIKDRNDPGQTYKYALVVEVEMDGDEVLLVEDPMIVNKAAVRYSAKRQPPPSSEAPPGTNAGN